MNDSKISIKLSDVVGSFIKSIFVENLSEFAFQNSSGLIKVEVELEDVEVSGCDDNFDFGIFENWVEIVLSNS